MYIFLYMYFVHMQESNPGLRTILVVSIHRHSSSAGPGMPRSRHVPPILGVGEILVGHPPPRPPQGLSLIISIPVPTDLPRSFNYGEPGLTVMVKLTQIVGMNSAVLTVPFWLSSYSWPQVVITACVSSSRKGYYCPASTVDTEYILPTLDLCLPSGIDSWISLRARHTIGGV